jgi:hypothetical protein
MKKSTNSFNKNNLSGSDVRAKPTSYRNADSAFTKSDFSKIKDPSLLDIVTYKDYIDKVNDFKKKIDEYIITKNNYGQFNEFIKWLKEFNVNQNFDNLSNKIINLNFYNIYTIIIDNYKTMTEPEKIKLLDLFKIIETTAKNLKSAEKERKNNKQTSKNPPITKLTDLESSPLPPPQTPQTPQTLQTPQTPPSPPPSPPPPQPPPPPPPPPPHNREPDQAEA